jgi:hypothetical protein
MVAPWGHFAIQTAVSLDTFPNLGAVDGHIGIDLEAQLHFGSLNLQHLDFEEAMKTIGPANDHRFLAFPRQD